MTPNPKCVRVFFFHFNDERFFILTRYETRVLLLNVYIYICIRIMRLINLSKNILRLVIVFRVKYTRPTVHSRNSHSLNVK